MKTPTIGLVNSGLPLAESFAWILAESACENSWKTIDPPLFHKVYSFLGPVDPYFHAEIC